MIPRAGFACPGRLLWLGGLAVVLASPPAAAIEVACAPDTVGLDSSIWNTGRGTFLGRALGQTFLAADTLITRITVWRPPNIVDSGGAHLFVTAVNATLTPPRPDTGKILLDGPTVVVPDSDPPGQLIRVDFILEPPLAVPQPGFYAFFVQRAGCNIGETRLTASENDPYPHGSYWITGRALTACVLAPVDTGEGFTDLVFEIEFCKTSVTPVRPRSWGELKLLYR